MSKKLFDDEDFVSFIVDSQGLPEAKSNKKHSLRLPNVFQANQSGQPGEEC